jgi:acyl-CoA dehydrogenase
MFFEFDEEQKMIIELVANICKNEVEPRAAETDETMSYPSHQMKVLCDQGLHGLIVPEEYGGYGQKAVLYLRVVEEIGKVCAATCTVFAASSSLSVYPILLGGNDDQKKRWLPKLASGEYLASFCLTEPHAGSDAAGIKTTAVRDGDDYIINGNKQWITNGDVAGYYTLFVMTDPSKGLRGISAIVVEKDTPGLVIGKKEKKLGIRGSSTTELHFEDMRVPVENRLGDEGSGFYLAMKVLDRARPTIGAEALGIAQSAFDKTVAYCKERVQFGRPIAKFQAIQFKLADMATMIHNARLNVYYAGWLIDKGVKHYSKEAAMAKVYASDIAMQITTDCVQLHGGYGYSQEYPLERMMRDAKIQQIYEGTNEIQRVVIAHNILR